MKAEKFTLKWNNGREIEVVIITLAYEEETQLGTYVFVAQDGFEVTFYDYSLRRARHKFAKQYLSENKIEIAD